MMLWFILFFAVAAFAATEWWSRALLECFVFILAAMCIPRRDFAPPSSGLLLGFGAIIIVGIVQALNLRPFAGPSGLFPFSAGRAETLYALLLWIALAALYWTATGILEWEGSVQRLARAIFGIGLFIAVIGILQRGQGNVAYYGFRPIRHGRPFGPFTNYDHAANWMVAATLLGAGLLGDQFQHRIRGPLSDRVAQSVLIAFTIGVSIFAVVETGSRGAINSFIAAAFAALFLRAGSFARYPRQLTRTGLGVLGALYAYFLYVNPKWLGLVGGAFDLSAAYRISMYRSGWRMLADFPLFGIGLGGVQNAFRSYQENSVVGLVDHVHSSWLEVCIESGFIGSVAFAAILIKQLVTLGHSLVRKSQSQALSAGFFAAILAFSLHSLIEFNFQIPANAALFCVLSAAAQTFVSTPLKTEFLTSRRDL